MLERRDRKGDGALLADLRVVEVADRGAVLDPTGPGNRPGRDEEGLDKSRLASPGVADEHDVADVCRPVGRRCFAEGGPGGVRLVSHLCCLPRRRSPGGVDSPPARRAGASLAWWLRD